MRGLRRWMGLALPRLDRIDPVELGVHRPVGGRYVERDVDDDLAALVASDAPVVLVTGPRLAGTTRSLARAARRVLGDHEVLCVRPGTVADLDDVVRRRAVRAAVDRAAVDRAADRPVVIWVDDVPLGLLGALADPATTLPAGVRVLGTVRDDLRHPDVAPEPVLSADAPLTALPGAVSRSEARRGADLGWREGDVPGRSSTELDEVRAALVPSGGASSGPGALRTAAVLRAATDWERLAIDAPLSRSALAEIAAGYLRRMAEHADPARAAAVDAGRLARTVDACSTGRGALLHRTRRHDRLHHVVDPRLTVVADDLVGTDDAWSAPASLADAVDAVVTDPAARRAVAVLALHRHLDAVTLRLLTDVEPGEVTARTAYGVGFAALAAGPDGDADGDVERHDEARRWFAGVVSGGDPEYRPRAAFWVGLERGADPEVSRAHLRIVVEEGPDRDVSDAAYMLGVLARESGWVHEQRRWLEVAARSGFAAGDRHRGAEALLEAADLDRRAGRLDDARRGYGEVGESGVDDCAALARRALAEIDAETEAAEPIDGSAGGEVPAPREAATVVLAEVPTQRAAHEEPAREETPAST